MNYRNEIQMIHIAVTKADKRCSTFCVEHLQSLSTAFQSQSRRLWFQSGQPTRQRLSGPIQLPLGRLSLAVNQGCKKP